MTKKQKFFTLLIYLFMFFIADLFFISEPKLVYAATNTSSVALNRSSAYLVTGETTKLKVTGTTQKVVWTSTNKAVATVKSDGRVTAVRYGTAYIRATVNKKRYECKITVINPADITFQPTDTKVIVNGTGTELNPISYIYNIDEIKKAGLTYQVNRNSGVMVSSTGTVTATKAGGFKIVVYLHGKKLTTITMEAISFEGLKVSELSIDTNKREFVGFAGDITPITKDVKVSSSNPSIAEVEFSYKVDLNNNIDRYKGIYVKTIKDGTCTVTVTISGVTKELKVIVGDGSEKKFIPVEAVQKNDYTGYYGTALTTMTEVRKFFDENNLFSSSVSDREKITIIQKYLNKTYSGKLIDETYQEHISGVFFAGSGICASYTETFCFLCECLGIEVYYCIGSADNGDGTGFGGHSWNKVKADGTWYYIDTYWNACLSNFKYFLTETLWADHEILEEGYIVDLMYSGEIPYSITIQ